MPRRAERASSRTEKIDDTQDLSPSLEKVVRQIEAEADDLEVRTIKSRWRIGELIQEVQEGALIYGKHSFTQLARYFKADRIVLSQAKTCYQTFTKTEIDEFIGARTKGGKALSWSILMQLARIKEPKMRAAFRARALNQNLGLRALRQIIDHHLSAEKVATVRKTKRPSPRKS